MTDVQKLTAQLISAKAAREAALRALEAAEAALTDAQRVHQDACKVANEVATKLDKATDKEAGVKGNDDGEGGGE